MPDRCVIDVDIRYLPEQDPDAILERGARDRRRRGDPDLHAAAGAWSTATRPSCGRCARRPAAHHDGEPMSVGRDGASDAVSFLRVGVPAVEFGPVGDGHHGPEEWVSVSSLESYRQALDTFLRSLIDPPELDD